MESEIFRQLAANGAFAILFGWLLIYTLKQNEKRETGYQQTIEKNQSIIEKLSSTINSDIGLVKKDIEEIKEKLK